MKFSESSNSSKIQLSSFILTKLRNTHLTAVVVPLSAFCDVIRVRSDAGMRDLMRPQLGLRVAVTL